MVFKLQQNFLNDFFLPEEIVPIFTSQGLVIRNFAQTLDISEQAQDTE
jgi:hypothetical protein